ncbi:nicotinamide riboside transporter PnuC [Dasania marina]|uniref:nicotinamide riboside transporter PnuC n=1 Tax=Dasania marina TaxID=471499 RepID=UPI0030D818DF|tara:strand:- start:54880 stop:55506 length:627 start_codon:yes stop_codon:yes gene_type:complete
MDFSDAILAAWQAMSLWELAAVLLGVAYLLLAMKEKISCWYAALGSTAIYTVLFWDVSLLMDSALQVYYMAMAVYGWYQWQRKTDGGKAALPISCWSWQTHSAVIASTVWLSVMSGWLLQENTDAAWPFLDSFTTWGAVVTTYMVAKKVLENWLYWIVIDSVAAYLYVDRGLYLTALLMAIYVVIVVIGYVQWRAIYRDEQGLCPATA